MAVELACPRHILFLLRVIFEDVGYFPPDTPPG
jgi:hypothetical protein